MSSASLFNPLRNITLARWMRLLAGLACFGLGVALMKRADIGLGPWDVLNDGLSRQSGLQLGTISSMLGVPILLLWLPLRQRPGVGTIGNIALIGVVTNTMLGVLPTFDLLGLQVTEFAAGLAVMGLGTALYLSARLGPGPRDGLMLGLSLRTGWSVRITRTLIELVVLGAGWLLGGTVGAGTLAFALGIGPVVQTMLRIVPIEAPAALPAR